jgi:hypothetical protein
MLPENAVCSVKRFYQKELLYVNTSATLNKRDPAKVKPKTWLEGRRDQGQEERKLVPEILRAMSGVKTCPTVWWSALRALLQ